MTPPPPKEKFSTKIFLPLRGPQMTPRNPVPGLTRDLHRYSEAPDQVRGEIALKVNSTLTPTRNPLKSHTPKSRPLWTRP